VILLAQRTSRSFEMVIKSRLIGLPLSRAQKGFVRNLTILALSVVCASLAGCAADDIAQANGGGCYKCTAFAGGESLYDGKAVRFAVAQRAAAQSQMTQPAADSSITVKP
jgi:hypothetical protein